MRESVYVYMYAHVCVHKLVHTYNTLTKDVFVDSAIWLCWFSYHIMRLPYFLRNYVVNPLIQTFVSSELLPGKFKKNEIVQLKGLQLLEIYYPAMNFLFFRGYN